MFVKDCLYPVFDVDTLLMSAKSGGAAGLSSAATGGVTAQAVPVGKRWHVKYASDVVYQDSASVEEDAVDDEDVESEEYDDLGVQGSDYIKYGGDVVAAAGVVAAGAAGGAVVGGLGFSASEVAGGAFSAYQMLPLS